MAISIDFDVVDGMTYVDSLDGILHRRIIKVKGLPAGLGSQIGHAACQAVDAVTGRFVPRPGDFHPDVPDLVCVSVEVVNVDNSKTNVIIAAVYRDASAWIIRINGTSVRELTRFDKEGKVMQVQYKPGAPASFHPGDNNSERVPGVRPMAVQFEVLRPNDVLRLERPMWPQFPVVTFRKARRCTNKAQWQGEGPHTWMFEELDAVRLDVLRQSNIWRVAMDFRFQGHRTAPGGGDYIMTWDPVAWYVDASSRNSFPEIDPKAGGYPQNKVGNGWREFSLYHEFDFDSLGLPVVF